jgi:carboxyl-terminal processing protease
MAERRRSLLLVPLVIAACSLAGGLYGPGLEGAASPAGDQEIDASVKAFTKVLALVEDNFADPVSPDKVIYKGAVMGMLRTLDPHSTFFDPRDYQLLREEQKGHYFGVGMQIGLSRTGNGKVMVIEPFPGSPSYRAGIRPGDYILAVEDRPTDKLNLNEVADLLKGPRGTKVKVTFGREGSEQPFTILLTRDEIPRKSVKDTFWVRPGTGIAYLDIDQFNENTSREVEEGIRGLGEQNFRGLILDLRGNPGGLLNEGVAVADRFLRKGQTIVSHRGRASAEKPYAAKVGNSGYDYPIVVLVDRNSASAAEIVAGALQDHDRAWILGERSFGKGLVQTVYPLTENTGLALTTAHYYTPSGRLIQRDYSNISFLDYYYGRRSEEPNPPQDVKMTDSGRTVYGGGGIAPDEKYPTPELDRFQIDLKLRRYAFFIFTAKYFGTHEAKLPKNWAPDEDILNEFHRYLLEDKVSFTEAEFAQHHDWIRSELRYEMYLTAFGVDEARRLKVENDPEVARAIESLPKAKALLENAKRVVAQRVRK